MTETLILRTGDDISETLGNPSDWLKENLKRDFRNLQPSPTPKTTEIVFYAHQIKEGSDSDVFEVARMKPSDLYPYSDSPIIDFLNSICQLSDQLDEIKQIDDADIDYELKTVALWRDIRNLVRFSRISTRHNELIATLHILTVGANAVLDSAKKLDALERSFQLIRDRLNITEDILDQIEDNLENAGFDLNYAMRYMKEESEESVIA